MQWNIGQYTCTVLMQGSNRVLAIEPVTVWTLGSDRRGGPTTIIMLFQVAPFGLLNLTKNLVITPCSAFITVGNFICFILLTYIFFKTSYCQNSGLIHVFVLILSLVEVNLSIYAKNGNLSEKLDLFIFFLFTTQSVYFQGHCMWAHREAGYSHLQMFRSLS